MLLQDSHLRGYSIVKDREGGIKRPCDGRAAASNTNHHTTSVKSLHSNEPPLTATMREKPEYRICEIDFFALTLRGPRAYLERNKGPIWSELSVRKLKQLECCRGTPFARGGRFLFGRRSWLPGPLIATTFARGQCL